MLALQRKVEEGGLRVANSREQQNTCQYSKKSKLEHRSILFWAHELKRKFARAQEFRTSPNAHAHRLLF
jgi:hypothetical protein